MVKEKNIPKLRFPDFEGEWEEKRLGEVYNITSSKRVYQNEWTKTGVPFYRAREIVKLNEIGKVDNELYISNDMYEEYKERYGVPQKNDLLVTGVGTIGKLYLVKDNERFYFKDGNIIWFKSLNIANSHYVKQLFQSKIVQKQIEDNASITTVGTYTIDSAKKTIIPFPSLQEQTKIANFLSSIDKKITELKRKKNLLEQYKKGVMQKIFSQELRFKDETGKDYPKWEKKKLGEIYNITSSKRVYQNEWTKTGVPFYRAREIVKLNETDTIDNELYISNEMYEGYKARYGVPQKNDLLVTGVGTIGKLYLVKDNERFYFKDGNIIWLKSLNIANSQFVKQLFQSRIVKKQIEDNASITTVGTYTIDSANKTIVPFPSLQEQTKITNFFSAIDKKIYYTQTQIEKTEQWKKGLLQKMFT